MEYRKFSADVIFDGFKLMQGDEVLIFKKDGTFEALVPMSEAGEGIERYEGLISPGLINCHCHLELSHLKGKIPKGTGLVDFVFRVVTERHYAEEEILTEIQKADEMMAQSGIVAVGDICNNLLTISKKKDSKIKYQNFIEVSGWAPDVAGVRFEKSRGYFSEFDNYFDNNSMVPHAPYSVSEPLWEMLSATFDGKVVSIHNQETKDENLFFEEGKGAFMRMYEMMKIDNSHFVAPRKSSVKSYFDKLFNAKNIILVHNTFTGQEDINYINENLKPGQLVNYCLCVNANIYIENKVPPIDLFQSNNCRLVIGTDSLASNDFLSVVEEMKTIQKYLPEINLEELLRWATINGAQALGFEKTFGSFEKGKQPGIVLIDKLEKGKLTNNSTSLRLL